MALTFSSDLVVLSQKSIRYIRHDLRLISLCRLFTVISFCTKTQTTRTSFWIFPGTPGRLTSSLYMYVIPTSFFEDGGNASLSPIVRGLPSIHNLSIMIASSLEGTWASSLSILTHSPSHLIHFYRLSFPG